MKKLVILIFAIVLTVVTYDFYTTRTENLDIEDKTSISYRIEEDNNLITETSDEEVTEEELTTYVSTINDEIDTIVSKEQLTSTDETTLKNTFVTLTDFIFYGGTIKGKTFNDLTTSTKEQIITLYETIDAKIESKFPNYKETIKETSTKTYTNIKDKLTTLKDNLLLSYKEEIGEENYNDQSALLDESISTLKESFTPVIDTIVEKSKEVYEDTKNKADTWYQEWKEENIQ